jgi:acyl dehydratase
MMRVLVDGLLSQAASEGAPGVDEVRWLKPLRPGTEIRVRTVALETRPSKSRPTRGFVKFRFEVIDEQDAVVMDLVCSQMLLRREPGAPA